jgi:hypothetical protein
MIQGHRKLKKLLARDFVIIDPVVARRQPHVPESVPTVRVERGQGLKHGFELPERPHVFRQDVAVLPKLEDRLRTGVLSRRPVFRLGLLDGVDAFGKVVRHPPS